MYAAIESMNGARFVHDQLELAGWQVEIADAQKVKGLAPLACKTDKIDTWVLAGSCYFPAANELCCVPIGYAPGTSLLPSPLLPPHRPPVDPASRPPSLTAMASMRTTVKASVDISAR